jgi:multiple sugar transport system substrate-binding protein
LTTAPAVGQFAPNELIIALDPYLEKSSFDWSKYTSAAKDMVSTDGHVWGIPGGHNTYALLYNKRIFEEVGLDPEKGPATIEELDAWADQMWKSNDDGSIARSGFLPWQPEDWNSYNWFTAWGAKLYDADNKKVLLNDENAIACYEWYYSHIQKHGMKEVLDWVASSAPGYGGRSVPEGPLYTDRIGLWHGGQWYVDLARRYGGEKLQFGVTPLPQTPMGPAKPSRFEADVLMLMSGSQNPDGGWEFVNWVFDPDTETPAFQFLLDMSGLPASLKYLEQATELQPKLADDKEWQVYADIAATGSLQPDPKIPVLGKMNDEINAARDAILNEAKTVEQALNDANDAVQAALDEYLASK